MDRLSLVVFLAACGQDTKPAAVSPRRVDAVMAAPAKQATADSFCELRPNRPFAWPELDEAAPALSQGWTWVNVWATWCGPCIEEMPQLTKWEAQLAQEGAPVKLQLMSVDATAQDVSTFRASHADWPASVRLKDLNGLSPWLASIGLDDNAVLPLHLLVDPQGQVSCVRMGGLHDDALPGLRAVVGGS